MTKRGIKILAWAIRIASWIRIIANGAILQLVIPAYERECVRIANKHFITYAILLAEEKGWIDRADKFFSRFMKKS